MEEQYTIDKTFNDIEDTIKSNQVLLNWFIKNQNMMLALGLIDSKHKYEGESTNNKVLAIMARNVFTCLRDMDYPNETKTRLAVHRIKKTYKLYKNDISNPIGKQLKLSYPKL